MAYETQENVDTQDAPGVYAERLRSTTLYFGTSVEMAHAACVLSELILVYHKTVDGYRLREDETHPVWHRVYTDAELQSVEDLDISCTMLLHEPGATSVDDHFNWLYMPGRDSITLRAEHRDVVLPQEASLALPLHLPSITIASP